MNKDKIIQITSAVEMERTRGADKATTCVDSVIYGLGESGTLYKMDVGNGAKSWTLVCSSPGGQ